MSTTDKVKDAIRGGYSIPADIARATGLGQGTVEVILDHLEHSAQLVRESLSSCPTRGCGSCSHGDGCSGVEAGRREPVLLKLSVRP
ncbi:MarR family transcriptional regulator [Corynebacterium macginleyi]|uniref:MarR family transcriptional regulator n=1 Tax=Corynebacterium macginleyi TaxID=38290 RepID=UPI00190A5794|nr:MarR family transcriptional regulator [Corynebacterium macginleyi]MBK4149633.1 MarR family transcriptional regulator [Corynebacterium macginleyi]MBK4167462.1 MarR family transcriptional regulator [Corynebacterium macginleyi]